MYQARKGARDIAEMLDSMQLRANAESRILEEPRNRVPRKNKRKSRKFSNLYLKIKY